MSVEHDRRSYEQSVVNYNVLDHVYISVTKICTEVRGSAWISTSGELGSPVRGTRKSETRIGSFDSSAHTRAYLNQRMRSASPFRPVYGTTTVREVSDLLSVPAAWRHW